MAKCKHQITVGWFKIGLLKRPMRLAPLRLRAVVGRVGLALSKDSNLPRELPPVLHRVVSVAVGRVVARVVPLAYSAADEGASVLCANECV